MFNNHEGYPTWGNSGASPATLLLLNNLIYIFDSSLQILHPLGVFPCAFILACLDVEWAGNSLPISRDLG